MAAGSDVRSERDLSKIVDALGSVPRVAYEAAHVYPLSAPNFVARPGAEREHPAPGPLKLYMHIPFCNYACSFCFYVKKVGSKREEMERYVQAIERELEWVEPRTELGQLYVGGGTPTALPPDLLDRALCAVFDRMPRPPGASVTVECSPESVSAEHIAVFKARGVERVSLGIESMDDQILDTLRRRHEGQTALDACDRLLDADLYLNVDLIYGLPGQTHDGFKRDLERASERGVHSISVYSLRLNERTPVAKAVKEVERMDLENLIGWREFVERTAKAAGFEQKRWHTFVRQGSDSKGFTRAPCGEGFEPGRQLGIGVSAVSHLGDEIYRNDDKLGSYLERIERGESPVGQTFSLELHDRKTLLVARTLGDGGVIDRHDYASAVGHEVDEDFPTAIERLRAASLIDDDGQRIALSDDGRLVYDLVTLAFYPDHALDWLAARQPAAS
jgi:oxygen-independent coproporphyrinogen-3 oxidase